MKKSTITIAVVVVLLLIFIPIIHGAIEVKRRVKLEEGESPSLVVSIDDMVSDKQSVIEQSDPVTEPIYDVPVYLENDLIYETNGVFWIGIDCSLFRYQNARQMGTDGILHSFPTTAIRTRDDDSCYLMYKTDTGYSLYLFLSKSKNEMETPYGFPLVIGKVNSIDDFKDIEIGDDMTEVESIDPVTTLYRNMFTDIYHINTIATVNRIEQGCPLTSVYYLKEGILMIEWIMEDDTDYKVHNIIFNDKYEFINLLGETDDYRVLEEDLPA
ncbi:MAG: hypothetical protein IKQ22_02870 [Clostridia bacterium]|nr:hypothetical protein [Clostridia bacterium]